MSEATLVLFCHDCEQLLNIRVSRKGAVPDTTDLRLAISPGLLNWMISFWNGVKVIDSQLIDKGCLNSKAHDRKSITLYRQDDPDLASLEDYFSAGRERDTERKSHHKIEERKDAFLINHPHDEAPWN